MEKKSVLLVEDEQGLLDITSEVMKGHFNIFTAMNGLQAWDCLNKEKIDCMVSDLALPDIDGIDLLIKLRDASLDIPVIIVTGKSCLDYAEKCADLGVSGYIKKPYSIDYLVKRINASIGPEKKNVSGSSEKNIHPKVRKCIRYINQHYLQPITRESVSEQLDISPDYLAKLFQKDVGVPFVHYLNSVRVDKARGLLANCSLSLLDVMEKSGFGTMQHFFKQFKKHTGSTPNEYRKRASC